MLNDTDEWPVLCPNCGHETKKQIGWLKENFSFRCAVCDTNLWFHKEAFIQMLDQARRAVDNIARTSRLVEKKS